MTTGYWDGVAVAISPDRVLLGPEGVRLLLEQLGRVERAARRRDGGGGWSPAMRELRDVLQLVSASGHGCDGSQAGSGHADIPLGSLVSPSAQDERIGTSEVAVMIGKSERHTRRLILGEEFGPVSRFPGRLLVSRTEVAAWVAERRSG